jgi:hypothetical protein
LRRSGSQLTTTLQRLHQRSHRGSAGLERPPSGSATDSPEPIRTLINLAVVNENLGHDDETHRVQDRALRIGRTALPATHALRQTLEEWD